MYVQTSPILIGLVHVCITYPIHMHSNLNADLMYPKDNVSFQEKQQLQEWKLILAKQTKFFVLDLHMFFYLT